jgi:amino acid transporter
MGAHQQDDIVATAPRVEDTQDFTEDEKPVLNHGGHGPTQRRLKDYHITWIGLCSGIGTGLFIGAGSAYATAGPAGLLLAYIVVGSVLWCVMQSISELATLVMSNHPLSQH